MVPDVTAPVERFHRVLVDEICRQRPDYLSHSFQLSEIYQRLVPYRSHRDALGLDMNGDYEDVLLRLLAGAGDLVILESPEARDQIRKELDSKNPNTGLFREFADAPVRLNAAGLTAVDADIEAAEAATAGPETEAPVAPVAEVATGSGPEAATTTETPTAEPEPGEAEEEPEFAAAETTYFDFETTALDAVELEPAAPKARSEQSAEASAAEVIEETGAEAPAKEPIAGIWKPGHPIQETAKQMTGEDCGWCGDALPDRDEVNFCPFCGKTTALKPCRECGDEMELGWRFCVRCGSESMKEAAVAT